jgi:hypothetical protein
VSGFRFRVQVRATFEPLNLNVENLKPLLTPVTFLG